DPRFLGYAQAALAPWWNLQAPPVDVLVLRATIRQSNHDFDGALADLEAVLAQRPDDAQAWITKSVVLTRRAEYEGAKASRARVDRLAPGLMAATCHPAIRSLPGEAGAGYTRLAASIAKAGAGLSRPELSWSTSTLGEVAARRGMDADAEA